MCDDSLENQISRSAEVGDKLVTSSFRMTPARGFCCEKEPGLAVCLLPGTEIAFEEPVRYNGLWGALVNFMKRRLGHDMSEAKLTRFRQVDLDNPHTHHDAVELADGRIIKLTLLHEGQRARVLQLPMNPDRVHHHEHAHPAAGRSDTLATAR